MRAHPSCHFGPLAGVLATRAFRARERSLRCMRERPRTPLPAQPGVLGYPHYPHAGPALPRREAPSQGLFLLSAPTLCLHVQGSSGSFAAPAARRPGSHLPPPLHAALVGWPPRPPVVSGLGDRNASPSLGGRWTGLGAASWARASRRGVGSRSTLAVPGTAAGDARPLSEAGVVRVCGSARMRDPHGRPRRMQGACMQP